MEKKPRRCAGLVLVVVLLLVAYPLSYGPAVMLLGVIGAGEHPFLADAVCCVYEPLLFLPPGPLRDSLDWWINIWDIYDIAD